MNNLVLNNVDEHPIHGNSYIFNISKVPSVESNIDKILYEEKQKGLYNPETYQKYRLKCLKYKNDFSNKIIQYKLENKSVIAFGSTAKSMTVLNFCGINASYIDYMIDENPLKHSLYTPGSRIPVRDIEFLKSINTDTVIVITAWNFYEEIRQKIINLNIKHHISFLNMNTLEEQ